MKDRRKSEIIRQWFLSIGRYLLSLRKEKRYKGKERRKKNTLLKMLIFLKACQ